MRTPLLTSMIAAILITGLLPGCSKEDSKSMSDTRDTPASTSEVSPERGLPRLVDLGKGTCIPCKQMAPILEELKLEFEGTAIIEVIDLREDADAASQYGIRLIPTQIFFDSSGAEVWRHEGFLGKDAIAAKLAELGAQPVDQ
ncbi:MAG: thioredoxin family protein [Candidatus Eisenbacteria bacterium]